MAGLFSAKKYQGAGRYLNVAVDFDRDIESFEEQLEEMGYRPDADISISTGDHFVHVYGPGWNKTKMSSIASGRKFLVDIGNNILSEYVFVDSIIQLIEFMKDVCAEWMVLGRVDRDETKFICITGSISDGLIALDDSGLVWKYDKSSATWKRLPNNRE